MRGFEFDCQRAARRVIARSEATTRLRLLCKPRRGWATEARRSKAEAIHRAAQRRNGLLRRARKDMGRHAVAIHAARNPRSFVFHRPLLDGGCREGRATAARAGLPARLAVCRRLFAQVLASKNIHGNLRV